LLKGFEHVLASTDIVHADLIVKATIQSVGLKGAVGGLYGHDSYGVIRRAAAQLTVYFGGVPLTTGGLAGESWNGTYQQSAASLVYGTAVLDFNANYQWGPLIGSTWGSVLASSCVYVLNTTLTPSTSFGTETPLASLQSPAYFEIDLSWGESDRLQAAADLFQP
jgi:hypothetical protein